MDDDPVPTTERYRKAVAEKDGTTMESVLKDLLERAVGVAADTLIDADLSNELRDALQEVAAVEASLKEPLNNGGTSLYNYGSGVQFHHGGQGHQNHCAGGVQITGNSSTNHMMPGGSVS
ncbi:hypothetical protein CDD82_678 [Ophiocordyceps australis]|uniref:NACHT-NTPase and P-loop NTPases N-terminal domain-containing protein n=1 Tax=Ophiocordyceps australis TaxID=1399860 RepID=A0A2C5XDC7_9HYPO|nr:hypothetical protein CDD82_678 [Ophiocordyceps australis]